MNPTAFEIGAFTRRQAEGTSSPTETPLARTEVDVSIADCLGEVVYETTVQTTGAGVAEVRFGDARRTLAAGAHTIHVRCASDGREAETTNLFVVLHNGDACWDCGVPPERWNNDYLLAWRDSRLFLVPMNAEGTELRPDLVARLTVAGGTATESLPGILVVEAEPGTSVEVSVGTFRAVVSKPISARVVPLRVP